METTVIIPVYNRAGHHLKKAVQSVINQTYLDWQLIIVDDGSEDHPEKILAEFNDPRIKILYQEHKGVSSARNNGINNADTEFIAFLDSDDWFLPLKLEKQIQLMKDNPDFLLSHTEEKWFRNGEILNPKLKHKKKHGNIFKQSLHLCSISMSTVILRKEIFEIIGLFNDDMPVCEDYDFWLRVTHKYPVLLLDEQLTEKDGGRPDQLSSIYKFLDKYRIDSIYRLINSNILSDENHELAINELKKKCRIYGKGCIKHGRKEEGIKYISLIDKIN